MAQAKKGTDTATNDTDNQDISKYLNEFGIEERKGSRRILLVAPHGYKTVQDGKTTYHNDEMAGLLTRLIAEKFQCYAVINEKYKRGEGTEGADASKFQVNCNEIDQVETHLKAGYLKPLLKFKNEIKKEYGEPLVVHIHGIGEDGSKKGLTAYCEKNKLKNKPSILVGYGQDANTPRLTAKQETIDGFTRFMTEHLEIPTIITDEAYGDYCGWDINNMNQLFQRKKYKDEAVQSFQIEIRKTGFRDEPGNVEKAADAIGEALLHLIGEKVEVPAGAILPAEQEADDKLVKTAFHQLFNIFSKHLENAMIDAGRYIIKEFYNDDIELARNKKAVKEKSLLQLYYRLQADENGGPSKSWIYNAVKLVIQNKDLGNFQTSGNLRISHKVELLRIDDLNTKKQLIEEVVENGLTVAQLREKITELKGKPATSLPQIISRPEVLFNGDHQALLERDKISGLHLRTLQSLRSKIENEQTRIDEEIGHLRGYANEYKKLLDKINAEENRRAKASAKKRSVPEQPTTYLPEEPRIISASSKTDIPGLYGEWFMNCLEAGYVGFVNKHDGHKRYVVSLKPEHVSCFVFWSKNYTPFLENLKSVKDKGYNCFFHYTITGLPEVFEKNIVDAPTSLITLKKLSSIFTSKSINWRYDPIIISDITDEKYHKDKFKWFASGLEGHTESCFFSFLSNQKNSRENIQQFMEHTGIKITYPDTEFKVNLAGELVEIASQHGITMYSCAGPNLLGEKIQKAHCVDGNKISDLFYDGKLKTKRKPTRAGCGCSEYTDIGDYDTCNHGCVYCYANTDKEKAFKSHSGHNPQSTFLGQPLEISEMWLEEARAIQENQEQEE